MVEEWLTPHAMWRWSLARLVVLLVTAVAVVAAVVSLKDPALVPPIVRNVTALAGLALAAGAVRAWLGALVPWIWTLTVLMFGSRPVLSMDPELWKWAFLASTSGEGTALAVLIAGCGAVIWVWRRNTAAYRESAAAF